MSAISDIEPKDVEWTLWCEDTFDRECPRQKDAEGRGLLVGLRELWLRYLRETVQPNGLTGFTRFNLRCDSKFIQIEGPESRWAKLREWVIDGEPSEQNLVLDAIAAAHMQLLATDTPLTSLAEVVAKATDPTHLLHT